MFNKLKIKDISPLLLLMGVLLIFPPSVIAQEIFDGDTVYINDSRAYISATPHTVTGIQPVEFTVLSKQYTGNVNVIFGYNGEYLKPFKLERWNPHEECYTNSNNTQVCETINWSVITSSNAGFNHVKRDFVGKTDWYYRQNFPVIAGTEYKIRVWIEAPSIPIGKTQQEVYPDYDGKYDFAVYPSSWGNDIIGAYQNNQLFLLDPTINLTNDLELYWSFNNVDLSGSNPLDLSGNGYTGTTTGATTGVTGINQEAFDFTPNNYVSQAFDKFGDSTATFSHWINADVLTGTQDSFSINDQFIFRFTGGNVDFYIYAGGSFSSVSTSFSSTGSWHHVLGTYDSSIMRLYLDGVEVTNLSKSGTLGSATSNSLRVGSYGGSGGNYFNGKIDEVGIWNKALNSTEISYLYNSGVGRFYPFIDEAPSPKFVITAKNLYDDSTISSFNATIDGTTYGTTNGTLITNLYQNETSLKDVYVFKTDYFPINYTNYNVSNNLQANITQSEINFSCFEKITNNSLTCDESGTFYYNTGTYEVQANVTGYYPVTQNITILALDNKTVNFTGFANSYLYVTAKDSGTDSSINDFSLTFTDLNNAYNKEITGSGSNINETLISGRNYSVQFSKTGYETKNATFNAFSSQSYEFNVYPANSINISIRKESDLTLITEPVTIQFIDENETVSNYETSTGNKYITGLTATNYTINFISSNYTTRSIDVSFNNDYQALTVYLIASGSSNTVFTFQDRDDGSRIEGVTLSVQKLINTTWTLVESLSSDITGRTSFDYSSGVAYRFIATADNYQDKNWTLDPILFSSYIIKLDKNYNLVDNSDYNGVTIYFEPKSFTEATNTSINFTFSNPSGTFINYGFNATWNGITYISDSGNTGIGSNLNATLEIVGAELNDLVTINYYYELDNGNYYSFTRNYIINEANTKGNIKNSLGNGYGMGLLERIFVVVILAILVAGAGAYYGGALAGGVLAMFIFGIFNYTDFISWWITLPSLIIMFIVGSWRGTT